MSVIDEIKKDKKGITLIALVVTIIVLLILAGITVAMLFGEHGVIKNAQTSNEKYKIAQAREKLELVLNTDAAIEKRINSQYNQDDFLDQLILDKVSDTKVLDDIVITDGYAFELDRDVPKLGEYIGKESDLVFPTLQVTTNVADDYKTATITINAEENKNGISKIEIIQGGFVIKEYTYDNKTEAITENFEVKQNGTYVVKVYSKLSVKENTTVDGIIMSLEYSPNGNSTYKKSHQVKITVNETDDKVKSIKYQWLQTTVEPNANTFTQTCNNEETLVKDSVSGTWYLWTLLETEKGNTRIERSNGFNFDNQGPTVTLTTTPISITSFKLTATATDTHVKKISKYEFYVKGVLKNTQTTTNTSASYTATGAATGNNNCYVIVSDSLGNTTKKDIVGKTKLYVWERWSFNSTTIYEEPPFAYEPKKNFLMNSRDFVGITNIKCVNAENGYWQIQSNKSAGSLNLGNYFAQSSRVGSWVNTIYRVYSIPIGSSNMNITGIEFKAVRGVKYSKGTTKYTDVTSTNKSAYPTNDKSGSYWYVYKGIQ